MSDGNKSANFNCEKCDAADHEHMVQCDSCDKWYHYECVGVGEEIADLSWNCHQCVATKPPGIATPSTSANQPTATQNDTITTQQSTIIVSTPNRDATQAKYNILNNGTSLNSIISPHVSPNHVVSAFGQTANQHVIYTAAQHADAINNQQHVAHTAAHNATMLNNQQHVAYSVAQHANFANNQHVAYSAAQHGISTNSQHTAYTAAQHAANNTLHLHQGSNDMYTQQHVSNPGNVSNHSAINNVSNWSFSAECGPTPAQIAARQVMPKDLPHFHGDPEEWPLFINTFENSTNLAGYTNAENLVRLQTCLKGKALEMVRSRLLLPSMVPEVMGTLRMRFGRPELIIDNLLEKLRASPPVRERLDSLIDMELCVRNICATMESCNMHTCLYNLMLVKEVVDKLPNQHKISWAMQPKDATKPIFKIFSDWIYALAEAVSQVMPTTTTGKRSSSVHAHQQVEIKQQQQQQSACTYCAQHSHNITQCGAFKSLNIEQRWEATRNKRLCFQCLKSHRRRCFSSKLCGTDGCTDKHHPLLHKSQPPRQTLNSHNITNNENLFRIVPVKLHNGNIIIKTYAFLDEGSSATLIDKNIFEKLNMRGIPEPLCLRWTSDQQRRETHSMKCSIKISNNSGKSFMLREVRTVNNLGLPTQTIQLDALAEKYPYLKKLPIQSYENARPMLLIGANNWNLAVPMRVKEGKWREPIATKSRLGWSVQGGSSDKTSAVLNIHNCSCEENYKQLHELVKQQFEVENVAASKISSEENTQAIQRLNDTCKRIGNRFEVGLLWRSNVNVLPDSYHTEHKRMLCLQNKIKSDSELRENLQTKIDNLIQKGYATKIYKDDQIERIWYLPIFVTSNPNKPGKYRLVWDAAAKTNGKSLNDFMVSGPDLLNNLVEILLGFRVGRVAVCGDIEEMFHQIRVCDEDAHVQRLLWQGDVYVMNALSFGITCAPCIANYVRNKNADDFSQQYPKAAEAIRENHYMDDYIDSGNDEQTMLTLAQEVKTVHAAGGFNIRNWISNSAMVMEGLGAAVTNKTNFNIGDSEKILGVYWNPAQDIFIYQFKFARLKCPLLTQPLVPTKRELLQVTMSMFDPLGFLAMYTMSLKILLQDVWRSGIDWDEELPEPLCKKWQMWKNTIPQICNVRIPRCFSEFMVNADDVQLHIFVDAGELAYAAIAYLRIQSGSKVQTALVATKSKVAPLKPLSISRLDRQAALVGTRLAKQILKAPRIKVNSRTFWSDSTTVLKWLSMDPRNFKQFVMFRVADILANTSPKEWRWVPSKLNPADFTTKINDRADKNLWFQGPSFLLEEPDTWQRKKRLEDNNVAELREQFIGVHTKNAMEFNFDDFSTWRRLYRAVATFYL